MCVGSVRPFISAIGAPALTALADFTHKHKLVLVVTHVVSSILRTVIFWLPDGMRRLGVIACLCVCVNVSLSVMFMCMGDICVFVGCACGRWCTLAGECACGCVSFW